MISLLAPLKGVPHNRSCVVNLDPVFDVATDKFSMIDGE